MIVRSVDELKGSEREVVTKNWSSIRFLLKKDRIGFSLHETRIFAGTITCMHYKNHFEAVYCLEGEGDLEDVKKGDVYRITPGTVYALDNHDKHILRAKTEMKLLCVFNPPCTGREIHDDDGSYPLPE
ncbi:MAG: ectoine synthase [Nitrospinota bacterium]